MKMVAAKNIDEYGAAFPKDVEPGSDFQYRANFISSASAEEIELLIDHTTRVAEIQNTLRQGMK